jgi:hypothetical protein
MEVKFAPPSDPDDDYYLLNCFVCEEMAKPGQVPIGSATLIPIRPTILRITIISLMTFSIMTLRICYTQPKQHMV